MIISIFDPFSVKSDRLLVRSLFEGRRRFLKRVSSGSRFSCSGCATKRPQTPWNRITIPGDPLQVGRRDRAVQPGGRAADACGVDRRRPAGIGCHTGDPGADAAAGLAHWMLERFRLLGLISALCRIVRREIGERRCFAIIDDTLAPRSSAQAPGVAVRFDHAAKTNRPMFLLCQCFVTLVVPCRDRSVPLVTGLCRSSGNAGKIAMAMLRAVGALVPAARRLVQARLADPHRPAPRPRGHRPGDTALFALPPPREPARRGRLYGARLDAEAVAALPASAIAGYGGPGCAIPCAAHASSRASSSVVRVGEGLRLGQGAPAAV